MARLKILLLLALPFLSVDLKGISAITLNKNKIISRFLIVWLNWYHQQLYRYFFTTPSNLDLYNKVD